MQIIFLLVFWTVFLCVKTLCPGTRFVDLAGLELTEVYMSLPCEFWD